MAADLVPARFHLDLSTAVERDDGMSVMWDRLHDALGAIPGVFCEGGSSSLMGSSDLIPDSPLDRFIRASRDVPRGTAGCTCGTPPFAPPEPSDDCPHHGSKA